MDKQKIIAILGLIIGIAFLVMGFFGIKDNNTVYTPEKTEGQSADANSADPLGNIAQ